MKSPSRHGQQGPISGFDDAAQLARTLQQRFGRSYTAVLINRNGRVVDLTPFAKRHHDIDTALNWARCFVGSNEDVAGMVILSTGHDDVAHLCEDDLILFRTARSVFGEIDVVVHDWIQLCPDGLRSLATTIGQTVPWPAEGDAA